MRTPVTPRQAEALGLWRQKMTMKAVSEIMGVTKGRVAQMIYTGLRKERWLREGYPVQRP